MLLLLLAAAPFLPCPVAFAANPVQIENAKPGTTAWQLTNPAKNREIEGYASSTSVDRGGQISLFVSTADPTYTINVYRMGWYNKDGGRLMLTVPARTGILQPVPQPDPVTGIVDCNWSDPYTLSIPDNPSDPTDWASGVYLAKLTAGTSGKQSYIIFVVRDDSRPSKHLFLSSVNTYQAYNNWGGKSLYDFNSVGTITWDNVVGATVLPNNDLKKTGTTTGWDAGARTLRYLEGDGYVEFTATAASALSMVGLGNQDAASPTHTDIEFAIFLDGGYAYAYESGDYAASLGAYEPGNRFRVAREGGAIKYRKNGTLLHTSEVHPTYPLVVDVSLCTLHATVSNVVVGGFKKIRAQKVSFDRPYQVSDNTGQDSTGQFLLGWEYNFLRWLESNGYDATYCTDVDLHADPSLLDANSHKSLLIVGHPEYWSHAMRGHVEAARDAGINLGFFSANSVYWQVRFEAADRTLVCYKGSYEDPNPWETTDDPNAETPALHHLVTVKWREEPVDRPEITLIGVMYVDTYGAIDGDIVVQNTSHWIFAGTGLQDDASLGRLLGYEVDKTSLELPPTAPAGTEIVAQSPARAEVAHMTVYTAPSGATIFATGSMYWNWGLDDFNEGIHEERLNPKAQKITQNVLSRFETGVPREVVWTNVVGATVNAENELKKTGFTIGWDAGASSAQTIGSGDGYVEFQGIPLTMAGLGNGDASQTHTDIEFAIFLDGLHNAYVYESGAYRASLGHYEPADRFRVSVEGGAIKYRKNGALVYPSTVAPTFPLVVDTSLCTNGATVLAAVVAGAL